jgi:hypothetical protein
MSYETVATSLETLLKTITGFEDKVTQGDYRILDEGLNKCIVLSPASFERRRTSFNGGKENTWNITISLFIRYKTDAQAQDELRDNMQLIIDEIDQYPLLGDSSGVMDALVNSGSAPGPVFGEHGEGPYFYLQDLNCKIIEWITITEKE